MNEQIKEWYKCYWVINTEGRGGIAAPSTAWNWRMKLLSFLKDKKRPKQIKLTWAKVH